VLTDLDYVASHDFFGSKSVEFQSAYREVQCFQTKRGVMSFELFRIIR